MDRPSTVHIFIRESLNWRGLARIAPSKPSRINHHGKYNNPCLETYNHTVNETNGGIRTIDPLSNKCLSIQNRQKRSKCLNNDVDLQYNRHVDELYHPDLTYYVEDCDYMADWQRNNNVHPTCNMIHETSLPRTDTSHTTAIFTTSASINNATVHQHHDYHDIRLINDGGIRTVWKVSTPTLGGSTTTSHHQQQQRHRQKHETIVMKLLHLHLDSGPGFGYQLVDFWNHPAGYWMNQIESQALDVLSSSNRIVSIYGHCGHSQLSEYVTHFGHDMIRKIYNNKYNTQEGDEEEDENGDEEEDYGTVMMDELPIKKSIELLYLAVETAWGLVDVHSIDVPNSSQPTLAHADLHFDNIVGSYSTDMWQQEGYGTDKPSEKKLEIKLIDFNRAIPMKWKTTTKMEQKSANSIQNDGGKNEMDKDTKDGKFSSVFQLPCGFTKIGGHHRWRSPESFPEHGPQDPAKSDIYSLGSFFYTLLTNGKEPWKSFYDRFESSNNSATMNIKKVGSVGRKALMQGKRKGKFVVPPIPKNILAVVDDDENHNNGNDGNNDNTTLRYINPVAQSLYRAIKACTQHDPQKRPTSYEIANQLQHGYDTIQRSLRTSKYQNEWIVIQTQHCAIRKEKHKERIDLNGISKQSCTPIVAHTFI